MAIPGSHHTAEVDGVQIEVDAGFESPEKIYLFEAKLGRVEDFNIRQLYYPFKDWSCRSTKEIIPCSLSIRTGFSIFCSLHSGRNTENCAGQEQMFHGERAGKTAGKPETTSGRIPIEPEPDVPYPQANDLDKVIDIVTNFHSAGLSNKPAIAEFFDFDERQGDYYANAGYYLGLLKRIPHSTEFELTREGEYIAKSENRSRRNLLLLKQMLKRPSFNEIIRLFESKNRDLSSLNIDVVAPIIRRHVELNDTTCATTGIYCDELVKMDGSRDGV